MTFDLDVETVVGRVMKLVRVMRCIPHDLLGDTTNIYARAAKWSVLDDCYVHAVFGRALRVRKPAAAATNDQKVVPICHSLSPKYLMSRRQT